MTPYIQATPLPTLSLWIDADQRIDTPWIALLCLAGGMLVCAFIWSIAEAAFHRLTQAAAQDLVDEQRKNADLVMKLVRERQRTMLAITAAKAGAITLEVLCIAMGFLNMHLVWWLTLIICFVVTVSINALVVNLLGPTIGRRQPQNSALFLAKPVSWISLLAVVMRPVMWIYRRVVPPSGQTDAEARKDLAEDLQEMVDQMGQDENLDIEEDDREMLRSVFELGTTLAREIMVPRTDMVTLHDDENLHSALSLFVRSGFSRIPVIGEDTDDIHGVLYLKDVVKAVHENLENRSEPIANYMREATFIPETILADDLLRMMREDMPHLALCVDEWGGISGMVTIEDLVEEVVGDVTDEHDKVIDPEPVEVSPGTWQVSARLPLDELGDLFDLDIDDDDVDTVGGLMAKALGKVPLAGSKVEVQGVWLRADSVSGRRRQIATVRAKKLNDDDEQMEKNL